MGSGAVANGSVNGNEVSFDFGTSDWRHQGTVSGSSMNGTVTVTLELDDQVVILNGTWAAARQTNAVLGSSNGDRRSSTGKAALEELVGELVR